MIIKGNIIFVAVGGKRWIGGLYYVKNIIYTLIKNGKISNDNKIYILVEKENLEVFKSFTEYENISIVIYNNNVINKVIKRLSCKLFNKMVDLEFITKFYNKSFSYIYPVSAFPYVFFEKKSVYWIPDFQHIHLPQMFSEEEVNNKNSRLKQIAKNHKYLILSSQDAYKDYEKLYPKNIDNVYVQSFESYIEDDIKDINNEYIDKIIGKYKLPKKFIFLPNQFWKHKNHITAFKAVNYAINTLSTEVVLVCTGNTNDYRNKSHFQELCEYIKNNNLENNIKILGFISRKEQLSLMMSSIAILQPSLFEGWGTVVEDAKSLGKNIIMSDINVHYEQKNDKCIIFKRNDEIELAKTIILQLARE